MGYGLILLLVLLILLLLSLFLSEADMLFPLNLVFSVFVFAVGAYIIVHQKWEYSLHLKTIITIIIAMVSLTIGSIVSNYVYKGKRKKEHITKRVNFLSNKRLVLKIEKGTLLFLVFILAGTTVLFYYETMANVSAAVSGYSFRDIMKFTRHAVLNPDISYTLSIYLVHLIFFSQALIYVLLYVFLFEIFIEKKRPSMLFLFAFFFYGVQIVLTTTRTPLLRFGVSAILLTLAFIDSRGFRKASGILIMKKIGVLGLGVLAVAITIYSFGFFTGKTDELTLVETFFGYIASPIVGLDIFLQTTREAASFGSESFHSVYNILRRMGFDVPEYSLPLEFSHWGGRSTNMYTAIRRYINDFSIFGMITILFFLGFIYTLWYNVAKNSRQHITLIIYVLFLFPLYEFALEERFFNIVIGARTIFLLIYVCLIYYFLFKRRKRIKVKWLN